MDLTTAALLPMSYRQADETDVEALVGLVNAAYRGDSSRLGWTTEADLLDGQRTDADEISTLLAAEDSLLLLAVRGEDIVASVHLQRSGADACLGMFTVRPGLQGMGVGKQLMAEAERFARQRWQAGRMLMTVITRREELIAFYERRGYRRTHKLKPFPDSEKFGIPRVAGLQLEELEKNLTGEQS